MVPVQSTDVDGPISKAKKPLTQLYRIKAGMTSHEVNALLGSELLVGFRSDGPDPDKLEPMTIPQPYRQEDVLKNGKKYTVLYYISNVEKSDGLVSEDELTPMVFDGEILVGKGLDELGRIKRK